MYSYIKYYKQIIKLYHTDKSKFYLFILIQLILLSFKFSSWYSNVHIQQLWIFKSFCPDNLNGLWNITLQSRHSIACSYDMLMLRRLKHHRKRRFKNVRCIWFWRGKKRLDMYRTQKFILAVLKTLVNLNEILYMLESKRD